MLLEGYRVLDLTDENGLFCGKLLADLGAEVIAVEPPGGSPARRLLRGPLTVAPEGEAKGGPEVSYFWLAYAAGKLGITLSLEHPQGQRLLRRLVAISDVVVDSFPPARRKALGLGYEKLRGANPAIVVATVTPFGLDGPYAGYKATDLTLMALGGLAYATGEPERPPVRISLPQSYLIAGASTAAGVALALFHRTRTGEGQQVDVSAQQAVARTMDRAPAFWDIGKTVLTRTGAYSRLAGGTMRRITWPCKDGFIAFMLVGTPPGAQSMKGLIQWMDEVSFDAGYLKTVEWERVGFADVPQEVVDKASEVLQRFFPLFSKDELWHQAQRRRLLLYPVATPGDVCRYVKEIRPDYLRQVAYPELVPASGTPDSSTVAYLEPLLSSCGGLPQPKKAPAIGEHNRPVYQELLGLSARELQGLKGRGVI
jgi:crotonobetainyl-CoA:carnitine CoA-transferase CaiB-like acyl-CoA transferase